jgi:hypothetical protein
VENKGLFLHIQGRKLMNKSQAEHKGRLMPFPEVQDLDVTVCGIGKRNRSKDIA